ncbi:hypothetical protein PUMCH_000546 [Australozyma saopauloensis]|uniref:M-phase inducer phosphatase n=1 Tax=Australozyma saopauloensis TaxID=291208 RepID=A0AAX4H6B0_9ASCO|nr:hypothetical protein PUMCH_000546 [[Candida] saopauloensis]
MALKDTFFGERRLSLDTFVGSLGLSGVSAKLARSVRLPMFCHDETESDCSDNDTTLNDEDADAAAWLSSPTQKRKLLPPLFRGAADLHPFPQMLFTANDHLPNTSLRSFSVPHDLIPRVDPEEFHKIVTGAYANRFDEHIIVDCRFPYEYEGGHIENALNISLQQHLEKEFVVNRPPALHQPKKTLLVFHCEYSLLRGPTMAAHLRKLDRLHNADRYPYLTYPDIVVLEGGYKSFFDKYIHLCEPQGYVEMKDTKHKRVCEVEMNKVIQASKLIRAKSFNIAKPRPPITHTRSASLTTTLSSSDLLLAVMNPPALRRSRSTKVQKRRDSRPLFTQSLYNLSQEPHEPSINPFSASDHLDEFAPPPALFRGHGKSLSMLLLSAQLPLESVYSVATAYSSTDSLMDAPSPFTDSLDEYDFVSPSVPAAKGSQCASAKVVRPRLSLTRSNTRASYAPLLVSPTIASPLFSGMGGLGGIDDLSEDDAFLSTDPF